MTEIIVLDTDNGSDIDSAVGLAYLKSHTGCELLRITTLTGETKMRVMIARAYYKAAGNETPDISQRSSLILYLKQKSTSSNRHSSG